jgi:hypothetical protein
MYLGRKVGKSGQQCFEKAIFHPSLSSSFTSSLLSLLHFLSFCTNFFLFQFSLFAALFLYFYLSLFLILVLLPSVVFASSLFPFFSCLFYLNFTCFPYFVFLSPGKNSRWVNQTESERPRNASGQWPNTRNTVDRIIH